MVRRHQTPWHRAKPEPENSSSEGVRASSTLWQRTSVLSATGFFTGEGAGGTSTAFLESAQSPDNAKKHVAIDASPRLGASLGVVDGGKTSYRECHLGDWAICGVRDTRESKKETDFTENICNTQSDEGPVTHRGVRTTEH